MLSGFICNDEGVGKDRPEEPEGSHGPEVAAWIAEAIPSITALMTAANRIPGVVALGPETMRDVALDIHAVALEVRAWQSEHPCPDPVLDQEFGTAFDGFIALAEECTAASVIPDYDPEELDERAGQIVADLMLAMYDTRPRDQ